MNRNKRHRYALWLAAFAAALSALAQGAAPAQVTAAGSQPDTPTNCQFNSARGAIRHVIYIVFDNTHFNRDNPNVPSDLEQMPHLLNFLTDNGTLISHHH